MTMIGEIGNTMNNQSLNWIYRWILPFESQTFYLNTNVCLPYDSRIYCCGQQWSRIQSERVGLHATCKHLSKSSHHFSYVYVLLNDFFTAGNGVLMKQKLESKDLGKYGLMFYNSLFMLGPAIVFAWQTGDIDEVLGECRLFKWETFAIKWAIRVILSIHHPIKATLWE